MPRQSSTTWLWPVTIVRRISVVPRPPGQTNETQPLAPLVNGAGVPRPLNSTQSDIKLIRRCHWLSYSANIYCTITSNLTNYPVMFGHNWQLSWTRLSCTWTGYCCYGDYLGSMLVASNCTSMIKQVHVCTIAITWLISYQIHWSWSNSVTFIVRSFLARDLE